MTGRDMFAVVIRAFGAYFIYRAIDGGISLLAIACGFDLHFRNAPVADSFIYLTHLLVGVLLIAWADRLARVVYRSEDEPPPSA